MSLGRTLRQLNNPLAFAIFVVGIGKFFLFYFKIYAFYVLV